jgi:hypothetical protein
MTSRELTDFIVALLHNVAYPCHRRHSCCGGWHHRHPAPASAQLLSSPSAPPHSRVLERPMSPSPDRPVYRPIEPSNPNASPWGCRGCPCVVHGWGQDEPHQISVVTGLVHASLTRRTARISIGPRGRPQGPLAPRTTTPPTSSTPSLVAPLPSALPSIEAGPSGSGTLLDLKSSCGNRVLRQFTLFTAPISKGRSPGSWDSTIGPSR